MYRRFALLLVVTIGCMGCKGQQGLTDEVQTSESVTLLVHDAYSGQEAEEDFMITDQKSLQQFFNDINKTRKPGLPVPEVDFTEHKVWVYCAGLQKTSESPLKFQKKNKNSYIFKKIRSQTAHKKEAVTTPFYLYKVPKDAKEIIIE